MFDDGTAAKTYDHPALARGDEFAVFGGEGVGGGGRSGPAIRFFVGTAKEAVGAF